VSPHERRDYNHTSDKDRRQRHKPKGIIKAASEVMNRCVLP